MSEKEIAAFILGIVLGMIVMSAYALYALKKLGRELDEARAQFDRINSLYFDMCDFRDAALKERDHAKAAEWRLREFIANLHNRVRHDFSAEVEAATEKAFKEMSAFPILRDAAKVESS